MHHNYEPNVYKISLCAYNSDMDVDLRLPSVFLSCPAASNRNQQFNAAFVIHLPHVPVDKHGGFVILGLHLPRRSCRPVCWFGCMLLSRISQKVVDEFFINFWALRQGTIS